MRGGKRLPRKTFFSASDTYAPAPSSNSRARAFQAGSCDTVQIRCIFGSMVQVMSTNGLIELNREHVDAEARLLTAGAESLELRCKAEYLATFIAGCKAEHLALFVAERMLGGVPTGINVADVVVLTLSFED